MEPIETELKLTSIASHNTLGLLCINEISLPSSKDTLQEFELLIETTPAIKFDAIVFLNNALGKHGTAESTETLMFLQSAFKKPVICFDE